MLKSPFILFIFFFILTSFSFDDSSRFQKIIDATSNDVVKKKLMVFEKKGIEGKVDTTNYNIEKVITRAKSYLGTPHRMTGTSKRGIDCSGLIKVSHAKYGVMLPHSSQEQARYGTMITSKDQLERGDLVFFYNSYRSTHFITHVGIYLGDGNFIHASHASGVVISSMDDKYWVKRYLFGTRLKD